MKNITFIFFAILIISCNSKTESTNETDDMYNLLCGEFEEDIYYLSNKLENRLNSKIIDSIDLKTFLTYHKLTKEYSEFITDIETKYMESNENPFFINNSVSDLGKQYLTKTDLYRKNILELIKKPELNKIVKQKLRTINPKHRNGNNIPHIEYYFKGITKSGTLAFLKNRRRNVLAFENEFLTELLIKK